MATSEQVRTTTSENAFSWRFVTPMFLGSSLNPVNSSLIATALVPIAAAMHVSVGRTAVLVSALYLASSIAQPTAGKLSEEFGPRRVFLSGILLSELSSWCGASTVGPSRHTRRTRPTDGYGNLMALGVLVRSVSPRPPTYLHPSRVSGGSWLEAAGNRSRGRGV